VAARVLLDHLPELQAPIRERLGRNREALDRALAPPAPATVRRSEGGWYAVVQVPATLSEEERVLRLLEERDVLAHPGFFFDFPDEAFLVLSLLPEPSVFDEACRRLRHSLVL
jgi:aspartate/methionine/tyrosine aminotransferase